MNKVLTPDEYKRAQLYREEIAREAVAYFRLLNNKETKRHAEHVGEVDNMIMTGNYTVDHIPEAVANESLYLERFASLDRAYNNVEALVHGYNFVFPELPLAGPVGDTLQQMKNTHTLGLIAILNILEDRTEQLLREIKKTKSY